MKRTDQNHPMWRLLNLLVVTAIVWMFSYNSASNFDETEVKMITQILIFLGAYEAGKTFLPRPKDDTKDKDDP